MNVVSAVGIFCFAIGTAGERGSARPVTSERSPAYLVLELPSRRVIAESRSDVLGTPVAPGSIMKVFTLIAAMERGLVDAHTRINCGRTIEVDGQRLTCVHPDLHRPLTAAEALGHSCNVFFATVARRLTTGDLSAVLARAGLPPVSPGAPVASAALGLRGVRVTPRALLDAFLRVAAAQLPRAGGFSPAEAGLKARPTSGGTMTGAGAPSGLSPSARAILTDGLRLAATLGTAQAFGAGGLAALAKTGTAPMPQGGYEGLVVAVTPDVRPTMAVVVVMPGGAGAGAAQYAAELLLSRGRTIRVGVARPTGGYDIETMPLETYVSRVVASEVGATGPAAAMEAMAIAARTYAEANRRRHESGGFDLCNLTHCQVVGRASTASDAAAKATAGRVLLWQGRVASVYFSSWCGGHTEQPSKVWPAARDVPYLPAAPDPDCAAEAPWSSIVAEPELRRALIAAGLRGARIAGVEVLERDRSGRAVRLRVRGMLPDAVTGTALQLAIGRTLGWQVLKSTLFEVRRVATGFEFTGRGLGHGVGLCIRGAVAKARAGRDRDAILGAYFPGLTVGVQPGPGLGPSRAAAVSPPPVAPPGRSTAGPPPLSRPSRSAAGPPAVGSTPAEIRVLLPESDRRDLASVRDAARVALAEVAAKLGVTTPDVMTLRFHPTVEAYRRETGLPWWTVARTAGTTIDLTPLAVLRQRGTLALTLRHEFVHVLTDKVLAGRPLWVREGLALVMAGEHPSSPADARAVCPSDAELRAPSSADAWRRAYDAAASCVARELARGTPWREIR